MEATLPPDVYERLIDRLRHAQQYAEASERMADEALGVFRSQDEDVLAMTATVGADLGERLLGPLRQAREYAEAARRMATDALELLETVERGERWRDTAGR